MEEWRLIGFIQTSKEETMKSENDVYRELQKHMGAALLKQ
jgi:hypothetical protein